MLASLLIHNNYVTAVCMEPLSDMKHHVHPFHSEPIFLQHKQWTITGIYISVLVPLLQLRYIFWERMNNKYPMWKNPEKKKISIHNYY